MAKAPPEMQNKVKPGGSSRRSLKLINTVVVIVLFSAASYFAFTQLPRTDATRPPTFFERILLPVEINAAQRLPKIGSDIRDIFSLPGTQRIWAVGSGGLIMVSTDGGVSWQQQHPLSEPDASRDPQPAAATLSLNWDWFPPVQAQSINKKALEASQSTGYVEQSIPSNYNNSYQSEQNTFYSDETASNTADYAEPTAANLPLNAIHFCDQNFGVAVGDAGAIFQTEDGGKNWRAIKSEPVDLNDVIALEPGRAVIVGDYATVLLLDGGAIQRNSNISLNTRFTAIAGVPMYWWIFGDNGGAMQSKNLQSWRLVRRSVSENLLAADIGAEIVVVGDAGTVLLTDGRGQDSPAWGENLSLDTPIRFNAVSYSPGTSPPLIAVGENGNILRGKELTKVGGNALNALARLNNSTFIAGGNNGTLLRSDNAGKSWYPISAELNQQRNGHYKRFPALWYWLICVLCALYALWIFTRKPTEIDDSDEESIADLLASDRPLQPGDPDPLQYGAIARGLSRFMRNPSTEPPLTVAVTGAWGTGKSSLMNLLFHDLKQYGFTPVWFNAWHHQKGEQLLASLYANIRKQAVPGWLAFSQFIPVGLLFRTNLLFRRSAKNWLFTLFFISVFVAAATYLAENVDLLNLSFANTLNALSTPGKSWDTILVALFGNVAPVAALLRGMRAFGLSPSSLMAIQNQNSGNNMDPSARQQFAREFNEVANALELGRMVIFIDDLDRCSKENVVDILEAINFLSVSGDCYIVLGMDEGWVKVCIQQQFPEMINDNSYFADQYLEKMINIKVPVPTLGAEASAKLLVPEQAQLSQRNSFSVALKDSLHALLPYRYVAAMLLMIIAGLYLGAWCDRHLRFSTDQPAPTLVDVATWENVQLETLDLEAGISKVTLSTQATENTQPSEWKLTLKASESELENGIPLAKLGGANTSAALYLQRSKAEQSTEAVATTITESANSPKGAASLIPGEIHNNDWDYLLPGLLLITIVVSVFYYYAKIPQRRPKDSENFRVALGIWQPWILLNRQTPRAIKRYLNRVRYIAMRYRPEQNDSPRSLMQRISQRLTPPLSESALPELDVFEPSLVALSAIYAVDDRWLTDDVCFSQLQQKKINVLLEKKYKEKLSEEQLKSLNQRLLDAIERHEKRFGGTFLQSQGERDKFLQVLAATRMGKGMV